MPYVPPIKEGLLTDFVRNIGSLVPDLPGPIDDAVKDAITTAVQVVDPQQPTPALPEKPNVLPDNTTGTQREDVIKSLDTIISAIGVLLKFRLFIPDHYEQPFEVLAKALEKVRDWLD